MSNPHPFPRRPPRIVLFRDVRPFYIVTCVTARRRALLASNTIHSTLVRYAERGHAEHGVAVERYVVMPDHFHLFVCLPNGGPPLQRWVGGLKRAVGQTLAAEKVATPFWQSGFFDHVVRRQESYSEKWEYVRNNPVRAGLCPTPEQWPWQGELVLLKF